MKTVKLRNATLNVADVGSGPILLLVHGFPLDHSMWRHQLDALSDTCRVIAPDLRGFGASSGAIETMTMEQFADDMAELLDELGIRGFPKTSGGHGLHVYVRIEPRWEFVDIRHAAIAIGRELERRMPGRVTTKWWKEERPPHAVFLDYNQNAKDHTTAAAYSVRPVADARVSTPLTWDEVADVEAGDLRIDTVPNRLEAVGDPSATIDDGAGLLDGLLALADQDEHERGLADAPWPPHHPKGAKEPPRVQPSRAKKTP